MMRILFLIMLFTLTVPGAAQHYDMLNGFDGEITFRYARTGIPSAFMCADTLSQFTEFEGTLLIRGREYTSSDGSTIIHSLEVRKRGVETIRTSRRIISQLVRDVVSQDTIVETFGDSEGAGRNALRGWLFQDTTWNSPPCPDIPDTVSLYPYGHLYRHYTPAPSDSLDESGGFLNLRTLRTDCLDNAVSGEFLVSRFEGLSEIRLYTFNAFDWSVNERYTLTVTPSVETSDPLPDGISLSSYPNPSIGDAVVRITAREGGSLLLFVHDLQGRVLRNLHDGRIAAGVLEIRFDTHGLTSGQYYLTALTKRGMRTIPVAVLRKE